MGNECFSGVMKSRELKNFFKKNKNKKLENWQSHNIVDTLKVTEFYTLN